MLMVVSGVRAKTHVEHFYSQLMIMIILRLAHWEILINVSTATQWQEFAVT